MQGGVTEANDLLDLGHALSLALKSLDLLGLWICNRIAGDK